MTSSVAISIASCWSCVTRTVVTGIFVCKSRNQVRNSRRTCASSAPNGSSNNKTVGSSTNALAKATR